VPRLSYRISTSPLQNALDRKNFTSHKSAVGVRRALHVAQTPSDRTIHQILSSAVLCVSAFVCRRRINLIGVQSWNQKGEAYLRLAAQIDTRHIHTQNSTAKKTLYTPLSVLGSIPSVEINNGGIHGTARTEPGGSESVGCLVLHLRIF
jgi:hypothetical protein